MINILKSELKRTLLNDSINRFYIFSIIIWPLISFIHTFYNLSLFPINKIKISYINSEMKLYYFIFIGYCVFILFSNAVQSSWRLGNERIQGTLSQVFLAPISKITWLYSRNFSLIISNSCFFIVMFFLGNILYSEKTITSILRIAIATIMLFISSWIWAAFISSFFIIMRDGSLLFVLIQGPQDTFSGVQVPLSISPKFIRIIGSIFPLSYTITLLREILINHSLNSIYKSYLIFSVINILIVLITLIVIKFGESFLRKRGSIDFY